jgi:hypothetical protein
MTWRGTTTWRDRLFASLFYLIPLLEALPLGSFFLVSFPVLRLLLLPVLALAPFYFFPFISFAVFIGLYIWVVRNEKLRHFLRFNAMQALLLAVVIFLFNLLLRLLGFTKALNPLEASPVVSPLSPLPVLESVFFLAVYAASIYAIARCIRGLYAEMPIVSEAAYTQTR